MKRNNLKTEDIVKLAETLHGHLAPGVALGIRMSNMALGKLNARRGDKKLIGVSETARCLSDAMQAATGCTLGHGNMSVENYGKLALVLTNSDTYKGVRISLKENAYKFSDLMKKWMLREGKLAHEEEEALSEGLLYMGENYFKIEEININLKQDFESSSIVQCNKCEELIPSALTVGGDEVLCRVCAGVGCYDVV